MKQSPYQLLMGVVLLGTVAFSPLPQMPWHRQRTMPSHRKSAVTQTILAFLPG